MLRRHIILAAVLTLFGCGRGQATEDTSDDALSGEAGWSPCVTKGQFETCAEVCASHSMSCVAAGCDAIPMYCKPGSCEMATSVLSLGDAICSDPDVGGFVAAGCDDPIEFIFNDTARCCCEG